MKSSAPVAIVGGGFSGTILAAQLARRGIASLLIEGAGRVGRGVAYSTREGVHLLNVRAESMSAWPDRPGDFADRVEQEGGDRRGFAERRFFARYLEEILTEAVRSGLLEIIEADALEARHEGKGWSVRLGDGRTLGADALVLAIGNQEPERLAPLEALGDRFIGNPWGAEARAAIKDLAATDGDVLLVGTGLTMVDVVLSLDAAGHRGRIVALSRRGQAPRAHAEFAASPVEAEALPGGSVRDIWRWLRRRSAQTGWRAAVDSLRPHSHALWQGLPLDEQRRFLRHARPWWDVHRHRIAPEVADLLARRIAEGGLAIVAGRIAEAEDAQGKVTVTIRRRGTSEAREESFEYVINCTGPLHSVSRTKDPLLRSLLDAGEVRADALGIAIEVDEHSRAVPARRLWALGPLTKGRYWEIVAVPDIREQAAAVAEDICRELEG